MTGRAQAPLRCLLVVLSTGVTLRAAASTPAAALDAARTAVVSGDGDPLAAVVPAVALAAWALGSWLALTVLLTVAAELPGLAGRCGSAAARRVAPVSVRRVVQVALGLGLAAGVTCAGPAAASSLTEGPGTSTAVAAVPSLDWPTGTRSPAATAALATAAPATPAPATAAPSTVLAGAVVVAPGDSLWSLAERALGPGASDQQVAAAWPSWWAANRDVVGADPHVIHPGARLSPPSPSS